MPYENEKDRFVKAVSKLFNETQAKEKHNLNMHYEEYKKNKNAYTKQLLVSRIQLVFMEIYEKISDDLKGEAGILQEILNKELLKTDFKTSMVASREKIPEVNKYITKADIKKYQNISSEENRQAAEDFIDRFKDSYCDDEHKNQPITFSKYVKSCLETAYRRHEKPCPAGVQISPSVKNLIAHLNDILILNEQEIGEICSMSDKELENICDLLRSKHPGKYITKNPTNLKHDITKYILINSPSSIDYEDEDGHIDDSIGAVDPFNTEMNETLFDKIENYMLLNTWTTLKMKDGGAWLLHKIIEDSLTMDKKSKDTKNEPTINISRFDRNNYSSFIEDFPLLFDMTMLEAIACCIEKTQTYPTLDEFSHQWRGVSDSALSNKGGEIKKHLKIIYRIRTSKNK